MGIAEQILEDIKRAMRDRDSTRVTALRYIRSEIQKAEKDIQEPLTEAAIVENLASQARRRRESISEFRKALRSDLVASEASELEIILSYMPKQLSREELLDVARKIIASLDATTTSDIGPVMRQLMEQIRGRADGALCSEVVRELLNP